jgi:hypothetical protein
MVSVTPGGSEQEYGINTVVGFNLQENAQSDCGF